MTDVGLRKADVKNSLSHVLEGEGLNGVNEEEHMNLVKLDLVILGQDVPRSDSANRAQK